MQKSNYCRILLKIATFLKKFAKKKRKLDRDSVVIRVKGGKEVIKKEYVIKQRDARDCGACCLSSIIKYYGGYIPIEKIRIDTHTTFEGTSALNIIKASNTYGLDGKGIKTNYDELLNSAQILPIIAHIKTKKNMFHFVVIYKIEKNKITIMDPAKGYVKYSKKEFQELWTKVCIILKPRTKILKMHQEKSVLGTFLKAILKDKKILKIIIVFSICSLILNIILSFYLKISIDLLEYNSLSFILSILLTYLIMTILKVFLDREKSKYEIYLNKNLDGRMIIPFINHLFYLPSNIIKNRSEGEILTRVNDYSSIKEMFTSLLLSFLLDAVLAFSTIFILYIISKKLFLILCLVVLLYILVSLIYSPIIYRRLNDNIELETDFNSQLVENIANIESIKNLNIVETICSKLEFANIAFIKDTFNFNNLINNEKSILNFINEVGLTLINCLGIYLILKNQLSLINLVTFNSLVSYFLTPVKELADIIPKYNILKVSFSKINEFIDLKEEEFLPQPKSIDGDIDIQNLTYSYNGYQNIINNFSFKIEKGSKVFIDGKSGVGKSTICKLLMKYDEDFKGQIFIDDMNIKDIDTSTIRNSITYVSQDEKLFTDTIINNLTLSKEISEQDLKEVITTCSLEEVLEKKPLRLETMLIDGGTNLSGGEKQRLILARALLQNKNILILDEVLSEVSEELEKLIISNLKKKYQDKTIIYVSHRSLKDCFDWCLTLGSDEDETY